MNSIFALLYLAIQDRLKAITIGSPAAQLLPFIDAEYGQLESHNGDNRPPVSWPCGLIDIDNATFSELGSNAQDGVLTVILRLGFPPYSSTSSITPAVYRNKALFHYEVENEVFKALHGWSPDVVTVVPAAPPAAAVETDLSDIFGHLIRVSARTEERADLIRVRALTFTIGFNDYSAVPPTIIITPVGIALNGHFTTEEDEPDGI